MGEKFRVNSEFTLSNCQNWLAEKLKQHGQMTVTLKPGKDRSLDQNDMCFELYTRIGKTLYGGDTEHARRECKLHIGVPILRSEDEAFRESYDRVLKPLSYADKLELMQWFPVSSLMSVKQCQQFIDRIMDVYAQKGVDVRDLNQ